MCSLPSPPADAEILAELELLRANGSQDRAQGRSRRRFGGRRRFSGTALGVKGGKMGFFFMRFLVWRESEKFGGKKLKIWVKRRKIVCGWGKSEKFGGKSQDFSKMKENLEGK